MSGIVGSSHNIRGSGVVAKLGTDGQVFTSAGAGVSQGFEAAAGGGKVLQVVTAVTSTTVTVQATSYTTHSKDLAITPSATSSKILVMFSFASRQNSSSNHTFTMFRDDVNLETSAGDGVWAGGASTTGVDSMIILDSPSTTSAVTYGLYSKGPATTSQSVGYGGFAGSTPATHIIAMEIDGS